MIDKVTMKSGVLFCFSFYSSEPNYMDQFDSRCMITGALNFVKDPFLIEANWFFVQGVNSFIIAQYELSPSKNHKWRHILPAISYRPHWMENTNGQSYELIFDMKHPLFDNCNEQRTEQHRCGEKKKCWKNFCMYPLIDIFNSRVVVDSCDPCTFLFRF